MWFHCSIFRCKCELFWDREVSFTTIWILWPAELPAQLHFQTSHLTFVEDRGRATDLHSNASSKSGSWRNLILEPPTDNCFWFSWSRFECCWESPWLRWVEGHRSKRWCSHSLCQSSGLYIQRAQFLTGPLTLPGLMMSNSACGEMRSLLGCAWGHTFFSSVCSLWHLLGDLGLHYDLSSGCSSKYLLTYRAQLLDILSS